MNPESDDKNAELQLVEGGNYMSKDPGIIEMYKLLTRQYDWRAKLDIFRNFVLLHIASLILRLRGE